MRQTYLTRPTHAEYRQWRHAACPKNSRGRHVTYQVLWLSGGAVDMGMYDDRIHDDTDMHWVMKSVGNQLYNKWPLESLIFCVGDERFTYEPRVYCRPHVLLADLRQVRLTAGTLNPDEPLIINVIPLPPPRTFTRWCICDFEGHGCCITGRTDAWEGDCANHSDGCRCCGNNVLCRAGKCGHPCCEAYVDAESSD